MEVATPDLIIQFIDAAVSDGRRARYLLKSHPGLTQGGFYVDLVLGHADQVATALKENPKLATAKSGPQVCEPLLYLCFSRFAAPTSPMAAGLVDTARVLLANGADPDAAFTDEDGHALSALYAASGIVRNPDLTRLLLEAGANPNDGESLYHACENNDLTCLKLLLDHGAEPDRANALKRMLDREDAEGLALLLAARADPNLRNEAGNTALHWAVRRTRSPEIIGQLLDDGADINAVRNDGRTAYAMAALSRQTEVADLLRTRRADTSLSALDAYVAGLSETLPPLEDVATAESATLLTHLVESYHADSIAALLVAGAPVNAKGDGGGTALHWACWNGYADIIRILISAGAALDIKDDSYQATPAGWLHHGSQFSQNPRGDYGQGLRLLIAAGSPMDDCRTPTHQPAVDAVLRENGLI